MPPSSSATLGVVPPVHWPGVAAQATAVLARPATAGSARIAPVTGLGPLFVTVIVYVVGRRRHRGDAVGLGDGQVGDDRPPG